MKRCKQFIRSSVSKDLFMPCAQPAPHKLHNIPMCNGHYIEALEHGAQFTFTPQPKLETLTAVVAVGGQAGWTDAQREAHVKRMQEYWAARAKVAVN